MGGVSTPAGPYRATPVGERPDELCCRLQRPLQELATARSNGRMQGAEASPSGARTPDILLSRSAEDRPGRGRVELKEEKCKTAEPQPEGGVRRLAKRREGPDGGPVSGGGGGLPVPMGRWCLSPREPMGGRLGPGGQRYGRSGQPLPPLVSRCLTTWSSPSSG